MIGVSALYHNIVVPAVISVGVREREKLVDGIPALASRHRDVAEEAGIRERDGSSGDVARVTLLDGVSGLIRS
jgi:hypothetical protein